MVNWKRLRAEIAANATQWSSHLGAASEFATDVIAFAGRPTKLGAVGLVLSGVRAVAGVSASYDDGALAHTWHKVHVEGAAASAVSTAVEDVKERGSYWRYGRLDDQRVAYRFTYGPTGCEISEMWAEHDPAAFLNQARRVLRDRAGQHAILGDSGALACDPPANVDSEIADRLWSRIEPFLRAGKPRSIILTGPPGTGKSCAASTLARRVCDLFPGATTLRIPVARLSRMDPCAVDGLLDLLPTDVLLIDDIDRVADVDSLLDLMEHCRARQRLVVVTINGRLPAALKRPRRAGDEIFHVTGVGRRLALRLLGPAANQLSVGHLGTICEWPAAFVLELADRIATIPGVKVDEEISELARRVADNNASM